MNDIDRFHLVLDVIRRVPQLGGHIDEAKKYIDAKLAEHAAYIRETGDDMPEIKDWKWPY